MYVESSDIARQNMASIADLYRKLISTSTLRFNNSQQLLRIPLSLGGILGLIQLCELIHFATKIWEMDNAQGEDPLYIYIFFLCFP